MTIPYAEPRLMPLDAVAAVGGSGLPDVLLGYQKKASMEASAHAVLFIEKSRRIGLTWGLSAHAILVAAASRIAGGMDVFYIGFNLDMTREFIDTSASWAKAFNQAADAVEEFIFKDIDEHGDTKEIQAFRIRFASGYEIVALTSRPRSLRGRQGLVIIDEAAFHDDLKELMKAALALLMWGGAVIVVSTHDGVDNHFNEYIQDIKAGKLKYGLLRIDLDDALRDGLYKRICLVRGLEWSAEAETKFRSEIVNFYGSGADEELFCIPARSGGTYLSGALVESRMEPGVVIRYEQTAEFTFRPEHERNKVIEDWCHDVLRPLLDALDKDLQHALGGDFARSADLSVFWPLVIRKNLVRFTPFVVELHNVPFTSQKQILWFILSRLPNLRAAAFDARGNGQQMAEETQQKFGQGRIHAVMTSAAFYQDAAPRYKSALEDATMIMPRDADIKDDHRAMQTISGRPQIPDTRTTGKDGKKRHGDSLVAALMAYWSTLQEVVEYGYEAIQKFSSKASDYMKPPDDDDDDKYSNRFKNRGTW